MQKPLDFLHNLCIIETIKDEKDDYDMAEIKKVVLAYSGGLDTSIIIPWLKENFDYEVICCCVDCGQGNELDGLDERAKLSGAAKLYIEDITDDFAENYIMPCVQANAVYENKYLLGTSMARPIIAKKLVEVTEQSFFEGIKYAKAGNHLNDISKAIQAYAESFGFGVVRDLVGHGIGTKMHEEPEIPNFSQHRKGIRLAAGMTLAIEPMITAGRYDVVWLDDGWTVVTEDGSLASHYENTILVTEGEPEILSLQSR